MYDNPVFQLGIKAQDTSNMRSPEATVVEQSLLYDKVTPPISTKLANSTLLLAPFGLVVLWTIAFIGLNLQKKRQRHGISKGNGLSQYYSVPCRRCIFFKNNPYLKCAIHPDDALTVKAIDCSDYTSPSSRKK